MTIAEAAEKVLKSAGGPLPAKQIAEEISRRGLYAFTAKDPVTVVNQAMRKRPHIFQKAGSGSYQLARK